MRKIAYTPWVASDARLTLNDLKNATENVSIFVRAGVAVYICYVRIQKQFPRFI